MKFTKRTGVQPKPYAQFRRWTRHDFKGFCAYCYRHDTEAGGMPHFDQDHFEPNAANGGAKRNDYYNLYWSCKECNARENKGSNWPSAEEQARGERFCDPCQHDPEVVDFQRGGNCEWKPLTPAGEYTARILRLNERTSLRENCEARKRFKGEYTTNLLMLRHLVRGLDELQKTNPDDALQAMAQQLQGTISSYETYLAQSPFVYMNPPPPPDPNLMESVLKLLID